LPTPTKKKKILTIFQPVALYVQCTLIISRPIAITKHKKPTLVFYEGKKRKCSIKNYKSFAFSNNNTHFMSSLLEKRGRLGHGNEADFGFEFAEIFVIEKRLHDSATQRVGNSPTRQVGESAFECLKEKLGESCPLSPHLRMKNNATKERTYFIFIDLHI
jgi:hypothetical protein